MFKEKTTPPGFEPGIPWFVVRCLIRWATGPVMLKQDSFSVLFLCCQSNKTRYEYGMCKTDEQLRLWEESITNSVFRPMFALWEYRLLDVGEARSRVGFGHNAFLVYGHIFNNYIRTIFNLVKVGNWACVLFSWKRQKGKISQNICDEKYLSVPWTSWASFKVVVVRPFSSYFLSFDA